MTILLYHDVVPAGAEASSGFQGGDADRYKLTTVEFTRHLEAITSTGSPVIFSFDDGGIGAIEHTAALLERFDRRGVFFITTDYIGAPGFLSASQISELHARGHRIGSHSCSHPARMSNCSDAVLLDEWQRSCDQLQQLLGEPVTIASVPGGYYSRRVASAAAAAGIRELHTSEPVAHSWLVDGCQVRGRFSITRLTPPALAAALARGDRLPRFRLAAFWQAKKALKAVGGEQWIRVRRLILRRGDSQVR